MRELLEQTKLFDTNNYETNKGSKTGILLIHGFTNTTYELKKLIDYLAEILQPSVLIQRHFQWSWSSIAHCHIDQRLIFEKLMAVLCFHHHQMFHSVFGGKYPLNPFSVP